MSCMICNPVCGMCTPPRRRAALCPKCDSVSLFDRAEVLFQDRRLCKTCSTDLTEITRVEPVQCKYSWLACAYPCGRSRDESKNKARTCESNTPPDAVLQRKNERQ